MMTDRNLGRFALLYDLIHLAPDKVATMFAMIKCIPVRAEMDYASGAVQYIAVSEMFDHVEVGVVVPEYELWSDVDENGAIKKVTVKKKGG